MGVIENLYLIKQKIPQSVCLIAVSKKQSNNDILKAYNAGQKIFGENKVQELVEKQEKLPKDIRWHMIGHLQTNKVKYMASFVNTIQSMLCGYTCFKYCSFARVLETITKLRILIRWNAESTFRIPPWNVS